MNIHSVYIKHPKNLPFVEQFYKKIGAEALFIKSSDNGWLAIKMAINLSLAQALKDRMFAFHEIPLGIVKKNVTIVDFNCGLEGVKGCEEPYDTQVPFAAQIRFGICGHVPEGKISDQDDPNIKILIDAMKDAVENIDLDIALSYLKKQFDESAEKGFLGPLYNAGVALDADGILKPTFSWEKLLARRTTSLDDLMEKWRSKEKFDSRSAKYLAACFKNHKFLGDVCSDGFRDFFSPLEQTPKPEHFPDNVEKWALADNRILFERGYRCGIDDVGYDSFLFEAGATIDDFWQIKELFTLAELIQKHGGEFQCHTIGKKTHWLDEFQDIKNPLARFKQTLDSVADICGFESERRYSEY
jgi:hypothetical protein